MKPTQLILPIVVLIVWGAAVYQRCLDAPFIFDDIGSIPDNPHLRSLWPLTDALAAPPNQTVSQRPLVSLSLALNYAVGKLDVRGYHAVNIVAHIAAALLLFGVARRTLASQRLAARWGGSSTLLAFTIALLWMLHPLQTEAVAYIVQRTELFMSLFWLATLYCSIRAWQSESRSRHWTVAAIVACALGMASKQNMLACPVIILLWDRAFFTGSFAESLRRGRVLYTGLAATWLLLAALVITDTRHGSVGADQISPWLYLRTQMSVLLEYLRLSLRPTPLSVAYHWPWTHHPRNWAPHAVVVLVLLAATVHGIVRNRWWGVAGAWFFLILAPTSSILPIVTEPIAERRMHLPLAAVITVVLFAALARTRLSPVGRATLLLATLVLAAVMSMRSLQRLADYDSEISIWTAAVQAYPDHPLNWHNLGVAQERAGDDALAMQSLLKAAALNDRYARAHHSMGRLHLKSQRWDDARQSFGKALAGNPHDADSWAGLSAVLQHAGDMPAAIDAMRHAADEAEVKAPHCNRLGLLLAETGDNPGAADAFNRAIRENNRVAEYHMNLGVALDQLGRPDEALNAFTRALDLDPSLTTCYENVVTLLMRARRDGEAMQWCEKALQNRVDTALLHNAMGGLLARNGRVRDAVAHFERALELDPDYTPARNNLDKASNALKAAPAP